MKSEVIIFHDETKNSERGSLKGHVLLFAPSLLQVIDSTPLFGETETKYSPLSIFSECLDELRTRYGLEKNKLHFTDISGRRWTKYDLGVRIIVEAMVDALRHRRPRFFRQPLCFKVAVMMYTKDSDMSLYGGSDKKERILRHDETVLRILLKGAAHYLYGPSQQVKVLNIVSDGQPEHRSLSENRIIDQLAFEDLAGREPLRDYVTFSTEAGIIHLSSDHKDHRTESPEYQYANMLQMADMSLGTGLRGCNPNCDMWNTTPQIGARPIPKKEVISYPFREMMMKRKRGKHFERSGHFRSFVFSRIEFSKGKVEFTPLTPETNAISGDEFAFEPDESDYEEV